MSRVLVGVVSVSAVALLPSPAAAQVPEPPPEGVPPAPPPAEDPAPQMPLPAPEAPVPPAEMAPLPPLAPMPEERPSQDEPPAEEEPKKEDDFKVITGIGFRGAVRFQDAQDAEKVAAEDATVDELNVEVRLAGKVTDVVGWTANLTVDGKTPNTVTEGAGPIKFQAQALDLVGQLDFMDEFHVWLGRMLTPTDRSNFSGVWFMSPWNYPGVYADGSYFGPRGTEEVGREVGAVIWGNDPSGKFKYYAGVMDLDNPELSPLIVGRINYAIVGEEPGFYSSSTYYGAKDIVALGVAAQYQEESIDEVDDDLVGFNADLLAEFNVPGTGTITGEVGYYHEDGPTSVFAAKDGYYALASYLTPEPVGLGKIQIMARLQQTMDPDRTAIEGVASYLFKDYFAKLALSFTHFELPNDQKANWLQLGFQIQQ